MSAIDYWLTERCCLYTHPKGKRLRGDINHCPWPLQRATCTIEKNTIAEAIGITLNDHPTYLHFDRHLDVHAAKQRLL